jgi:lysophospholipase L1-like esterase
MARRFTRPLTVLAATSLAFLTMTSAGPTQLMAADPPRGDARDPGGRRPSPPGSMSALGDSITRAYAACWPGPECPRLSWATGEDAAVRSHYQRIRAVRPDLSGRGHNDAVSGARVADLARQARVAAGRRPEYVTILVGANDACAPTESQMTPVAAFAQRFSAALAVLREDAPGAHVLVLSIPDLYRLWEVGHVSTAARGTWNAARICPSMLARPTSTAAGDAARRARVRDRVQAYNGVLAKACGALPTCRFDGGAVFSYRFTLDQLSSGDYFHPGPAGQAALAEISYRAGYGW